MAKTPAKKTGKNSLAEQVAKLPLAARAGIVGGSAVVAGVLFYMLSYLPYEEEKGRLESAISSARNELNAQQAALKKHQSLGNMKEGIDWSYEYMQQYLPQENEMPKLVQMVSEIGARAGLTDGVTLFAPKLPAKVQPNYAEIPFSMRLQGEFNTVLSFLYDFSRMNRIVNITDVKIGSPKMVDDRREILHISVDCSGSTYRSLTEREVADQSAPKGKGRG
ncbi:MAG: type 4a pilus biogenesis protein PilO [Deltaproteobacteria bacterium]|nr:type 4a pilus biogenesis protein PilO [Deltaproteobacteria bacterium]